MLVRFIVSRFCFRKHPWVEFKDTLSGLMLNRVNKATDVFLLSNVLCSQSFRVRRMKGRFWFVLLLRAFSAEPSDWQLNS